MSIKINQMPTKSDVSGEEIVPIVDQGGNFVVAIKDIKTYGTSMFITDVTKSNPMDTAGVLPTKDNIVDTVFIVTGLTTQNNDVRVFVE